MKFNYTTTSLIILISVLIAVNICSGFTPPSSLSKKYSARKCNAGWPRNRFMAKGGSGDNNFEDPNPGGMRKDEEPNQRRGENFFDTLKSWLRSEEGKEDVKTYTTSLVIALLLRLTVIEPRYIPSLSMYPTFEVGDQLAVEKISKRIRPFDRNEVVVFNPPSRFKQIIENNYGGSSKKSKEALIKRIVAVAVSEIFTVVNL